MSWVPVISKWTYILFQVLALISTFVSFGAQLINESDPGGSTASWKWNEVDLYTVFVPGQPGQTSTHKYDASSTDPRLSGCAGGGQGLVGLAVISLLVFVLISLPMGILRARNSEHSFPKLGSDPYKYTTVELVTAVWHCFSFFCQSVIWGGTCLRLVRQDISSVGASVNATGFAYVGFCTALMFLNVGLMFYLRREKLNETGAGSTSSSAPGGENRAPFASVYNAAATAEPAPAPASAASASSAAAGGYGDASASQPVVAAGGNTGATAGGGGYQSF